MLKKVIDNFLQLKTKLQSDDDWQNKRQKFIYLFQIYSTSLTWENKKFSFRHRKQQRNCCNILFWLGIVTHSFSNRKEPMVWIFVKVLFWSVFLVCTWRHGGHIGVQNNGDRSLLGIWFYYYAKRERHFAIVLCTNMSASSRECNPTISSYISLTVTCREVTKRTLQWAILLTFLSYDKLILQGKLLEECYSGKRVLQFVSLFIITWCKRNIL